MKIPSLKINDITKQFQGDGLEARSSRGTFILTIGTGFERVARLVRNMILARLLAPESFGLMSIIMAIIAVINSFSDIGVRQSIIHNENGKDPQYLPSYRSSLRSKSLYLLIISILLSIAGSNLALAAAYYVDDNADPGGNGTTSALTGSSCAFDSLTSLVRAMAADTDAAPYFSGDTVYVAAGNYPEGYYEYGKKWTRTDYCKIIGASIADVDVNKLTVYAYNMEDTVYPAYLQFQNMNVNPSDPDDNGTLFYNVSHIRVWDSNFVGDGYRKHSETDYGVYAFESHNLDFNNLHIYGEGDSLATVPGIVPNDLGVPSEVSDPNLYGQGWRVGIYLRYTVSDGDLSVRNCVIEQCYDSMDIAPSEGFGNYTITNNTCRYFNDNAILLANGGTNITITDNSIHHGTKFDSDAGYLGGHVDCIQPQGANPGWVDYHNMTISRNIIYNCQHQAIFLNCGGGSTGWTIENNLVYNVPSNPAGTSVAVWIYAADNVICRNNTVIGKLLFQNGNGTLELDDVSGNIAYNFELSVSGGVTVNYENGNLFYTRGPQTLGYTIGSNSVDFDNVDDFKALFADYDNDDFRLFCGSPATNSGESNHAPTTDVLGNSRIGVPDIGCYEYGPSSNNPPVLTSIGSKSVYEANNLSFSITATDADNDTISYSATNLPSGADFTGSTFNWTPGYTQSGSYNVTFIAADCNDQDSEVVTITVNNKNGTEGRSVAQDGDRIIIVNGTYPENLTFTKKLRIESDSGVARAREVVGFHRIGR